jgi:hypothetical protein
MKPNAKSVIAKSIKWQWHVATTTKDPRQKARAISAMGRLCDELLEAILNERAEQLASATEHEPIATEHESVATNPKENNK